MRVATTSAGEIAENLEISFDKEEKSTKFTIGQVLLVISLFTLSTCIGAVLAYAIIGPKMTPEAKIVVQEAAVVQSGQH